MNWDETITITAYSLPSRVSLARMNAAPDRESPVASAKHVGSVLLSPFGRGKTPTFRQL